MSDIDDRLAAAEQALHEAAERRREADAFVALAHEEYIAAGHALTALRNEKTAEEWATLKAAVKIARDAKKQPQIAQDQAKAKEALNRATIEAADTTARDITGDPNVRW